MNDEAEDGGDGTNVENLWDKKWMSEHSFIYFYINKLFRLLLKLLKKFLLTLKCYVKFIL